MRTTNSLCDIRVDVGSEGPVTIVLIYGLFYIDR
jgi:hypothetical protein